jgi:hypothetical protein
VSACLGRIAGPAGVIESRESFALSRMACAVDLESALVWYCISGATALAVLLQ